MGQYGNQPDFGTNAQVIGAQGTPDNPSSALLIDPPAALYIGTGGTLVCRVVGKNQFDLGNPKTGWSVFKNIPDGTFFPVIVTCIWAGNPGFSQATTATDIIALS